MTALRPGQSPPPVSSAMRIVRILRNLGTRQCYGHGFPRGCGNGAIAYSGRRRGLDCARGSGSVIKRRHLRRIESDPEHAILSTPLKGRPVSVRPADGTVLHAEVFGSDGPWIVFAHGSTEALEVWTYVIRALSARG